MASGTMSRSDFTLIPNGTRVFNHGYSECVALANLYHEQVIGGSFVPVGSAYQWWTQFSLYATLTDNYIQSQTPEPGSVFVSRGGPYNNTDGHIGVVTWVHPDGTFDTLEQNASHRYVWRYTRGMPGVYGFLTPRNNPAIPVPKPVERTTTRRKMFLIWDTEGTGYLVTEAGVYPLASSQVYTYFYRIINSDQKKIPFTAPPQVKNPVGGKPDMFYASEISVVRNTLRIIEASAMTGVEISLDKLEEALSEALGKRFNREAEEDPQGLAAAFTEATPRVVRAMHKQSPVETP